MIADDDEEVHAVTKLVLRGKRVLGRELELLSVKSAAACRELLSEDDSVAVILLDVVMETDDAGLRLVRWIREELGNHAIRIILRTGQPGQAPEERVISD
ncbi:MAG TPA: response regulator receiver protein, partial [Spirochaetales bacterium]|nr:response regulator receiver protein [Spirochaetales bacterium]